MKPCSSCRRHMRAEAEACPFCGAPCPMTRFAPPLGMILGVALCGCGPGVADPVGAGTGSTSAEETSTSAATTGASTSGPSTTSSTSTGESSEGPGTSTGFDTGSSDDNGASSVGFYGGPAPDHSTPIECDFWEQDCPDGDKCMPWANDGGETWNALRCVPVDADPDQPGEPCVVEGSGVSGVDSCALGAMCFFVDPQTNAGTCVAQCGGTPMNPVCDDVGEACLIANDAVLALCLPTCDPLLQSCDTGQVCVPADGSFVCMTSYIYPSGAEEACDGINACDAGLVCVDGSSVGGGCVDTNCCTEYCDHTEIDPCAGGRVCVPLFDAASPVGVCVVEA